MAITEAAGFPVLAVATPPSSLTGITLGVAGDLVFCNLDLTQSSITATSVIFTETASPYTTLAFTLAKQFTTQSGWDLEQWTAVVPASLANTTGSIAVTWSTTATGYGVISCDEFTAGLGANTTWTPGTYVTHSNGSAATGTFPTVTTPGSGTYFYYGYIYCPGEYDAAVTPVNGVAFSGDWIEGDGTSFNTGTLANTTAYSPTCTLYGSTTSDSLAATWKAATTGASGSNVTLMEWTGGPLYFDQGVGQHNGTSSTTQTTPSIIPTSTKELLLAVAADALLTYHWTSPTNSFHAASVSTTWGTITPVAYLVDASGASVDCGWTLSTTDTGSTAIVALTNSAQVPGQPSNVAGTGLSGSAALTWTAPTNNGSPISQNVVSIYISGVFQTTQTFGAVTSATITGLTNGTSYTFTVYAINAVGSGPASAHSAAITPTNSGTNPYDPFGNIAAISGTGSIIFDEEFPTTTLSTVNWSQYPFVSGGVPTKVNNASFSASNLNIVSDSTVPTGTKNVLEISMSSPTVGAWITTYPPGSLDPSVVGFSQAEAYVEGLIYFSGVTSTDIYNWAAWWTSATDLNWPNTGEVDIAEILSGTMTSNYHGSTDTYGPNDIAGGWGNRWHYFGVLRMATENYIFFDGNLVLGPYSTVTTAAPGGTGVYPHYLILNVGVGNQPSGYTGASGAMRVAHVRVWPLT